MAAAENAAAGDEQHAYVLLRSLVVEAPANSLQHMADRDHLNSSIDDAAA